MPCNIVRSFNPQLLEIFKGSDKHRLYYLFIFFYGKENEPKETARVPLCPARPRGGRRARKLASLKQVRAL
ncbi:MAG: hypothetical protein QNJ04_14870, partial [Desulfobacterales bacterium]|nr:hypothetical protein [Desulfobacterales bacterium]